MDQLSSLQFTYQQLNFIAEALSIAIDEVEWETGAMVAKLQPLISARLSVRSLIDAHLEANSMVELSDD